MPQSNNNSQHFPLLNEIQMAFSTIFSKFANKIQKLLSVAFGFSVYSILVKFRRPFSLPINILKTLLLHTPVVSSKIK